MQLYPASMCLAASCLWLSLATTVVSEDPEVLDIPNSTAKSPDEMKPYTERVEHSSAKIVMAPIPGGKFVMGSPDAELGRNTDEGPQHEVTISPFWMSECEITWDAYEVFMLSTDVLRRQVLGVAPNSRDKALDAITRPTKPYTDMTFGMGKRGYPAICMTQHAAKMFCKFLTVKTGRYYRLPTEAEWEYACRAGTKTAYSFGDDPAQLGEYAWYTENSEGKSQKVRMKKPNAWGLYDMHGGVAEWVLDQYSEDGYPPLAKQNPLLIPTTLYPRVVRGGSWEDRADRCRSASRYGSSEDWKEQDPQSPQSIWYHTDALWVGFRIVRPLETPSIEQQLNKWDKSAPLQIDEEQK